MHFFCPKICKNRNVHRTFAPQFKKSTARSSHVHRITIAHAGLCSRYEPCGRSRGASRVLNINNEQSSISQRATPY